MNRRDAPSYFDCLECGHRHEIQVIPPQCPACGSRAAKRDSEAEARGELFRRAAAKAKGHF